MFASTKIISAAHPSYPNRKNKFRNAGVYPLMVRMLSVRMSVARSCLAEYGRAAGFGEVGGRAN